MWHIQVLSIRNNILENINNVVENIILYLEDEFKNKRMIQRESRETSQL